MNYDNYKLDNPFHEEDEHWDENSKVPCEYCREWITKNEDDHKFLEPGFEYYDNAIQESVWLCADCLDEAEVEGVRL